MERLVTRHAAVAVEEALADTRNVTLDDKDQRAQAEADPVAFIQQHPHGLLVIDEVQRVPRLALALKLVVDRDPRPGRFLLTGSANLNRLLAGDPFTGYTSVLTRADYLVLAEAGGYPEALAREPGKRRRLWLSNYATRTATELNVTSVASELGMPRRTLDPYLDLLDTGLAARLAGVTAGPGTDFGGLTGPLIETLVGGELRRQLGWTEEQAELFHYRDHEGAEVDFILATPDGRIAGIEVKAASGSNAHDARWLAMLRDRITSAPIDLLWNA